MGRAAATTTDRANKAFMCWIYDLMTLILTGVYCGVAFHDIIGYGKAVMTDSRWYQDGFCGESHYGIHVNSHTLCFVGDVVVGGTLLWSSLRRMRSETRPSCILNLQMVMAAAIMTVLHGLGHVWIGHVLGKDFMDSVRPTSLSWPLFACYYVLMASFLALGPYMGFRNGLEPRLCLAVHLIATWAFIAYVPNQFAFGAVQLYFNSWYCFPRVIFLGWNKADEVSKRVDDGWDVFSLGFLLLMPVVFAEMLACDAIYRNWGGHFLYDGSILLIGTFYARTLWRQCEEVPVPKKSV